MTVNPASSKGEPFFVAEHDVGLRLDAFITLKLPPHMSRTRVKQIIKAGGVSVNGQICQTPNFRLKNADMVVITVPQVRETELLPENIPLDIRHEDEHLLIINKPAGLVVHPAPGNRSGTLVNALLYHCGDRIAGVGGVKRPGIVHRLDKDTSGLLVIAKSDLAHSRLGAQFKDHGRSGALERIYLALTWGEPSPANGSIRTHLGRSPVNRKKRAVVSQDSPDSKIAITHYKVHSKCGCDRANSALASFVECRLETGRTHQIRVHMNHIGHPLIGDQDYGKHFQTKENLLPESLRARLNDFKRQALHAAVLGFEHPVTNEKVRFEAELPESFSSLLSEFRKTDLKI